MSRKRETLDFQLPLHVTGVQDQQHTPENLSLTRSYISAGPRAAWHRAGVRRRVEDHRPRFCEV